mmetsp:Transcript_43458/g.120261  ORF Transcript_43458/g.120261 Transcript_43458/m.120261 type:complete len:92 (+) Transcript_43458:389-664(+)
MVAAPARPADRQHRLLASAMRPQLHAVGAMVAAALVAPPQQQFPRGSPPELYARPQLVLERRRTHEEAGALAQTAAAQGCGGAVGAHIVKP